MVHGGPDWGPTPRLSTVYSLQDLGELAVRLGSIVRFDRRGNVIFLDSFEASLNKWWKVFNGTGAGVAVSNAAARSGALSAKLTTGNAINNYAQIVYYSYYPAVSKIGVEFSFTIDDDVSQIIFLQGLDDGDYTHEAYLRYIPSSDKLQYKDENDAYQDLVTGVALYSSIYVFHTIKFVIDLSAGTYVRAILNETEHDMSSINYRKNAAAARPSWAVAVKVVTAVNDNVSVYVDDSILTHNEP